MKRHDTLTKPGSSPAQISLWPVESVNFNERLQCAFKLSSAAELAPNLGLELPEAKGRYQSPLHAFKSIGQVARMGAEHDLAAYVVASRGNAVGMATTQAYSGVQSPGILHDASNKPSVELSWWLRETDYLVEESSLVVKRLVSKVQERHGFIEPNRTWSVTLPFDQAKSEALAANDFRKVAHPVHYEYLLHDGVTFSRQLWVPETT